MSDDTHDTQAPADPFAGPGPFWASPDDPDQLWGHELVYQGRTYGWGGMDITDAETRPPSPARSPQ